MYTGRHLGINAAVLLVRLLRFSGSIRDHKAVRRVPPTRAWRANRRCITVANMASRTDNSGVPKSKHFDPPLSAIKARQMGELARGDDRWDVLLESVRDDEVNGLRGRIHFVSGNTHRLSGWIFLEWAERDVDSRFGEFSAHELWSLLDSLS